MRSKALPSPHSKTAEAVALKEAILSELDGDGYGADFRASSSAIVDEARRLIAKETGLRYSADPIRGEPGSYFVVSQNGPSRDKAAQYSQWDGRQLHLGGAGRMRVRPCD